MSTLHSQFVATFRPTTALAVGVFWLFAVFAFGTTYAHAQVSVSGTLTGEQGSALSGETIAVVVGTTTPVVSTSTTDGSGAYSVTVNNSDLGVDIPILAYVDGTASVRGSAHTKVASTTADITNLDLTQNTLTLFQQGATSTTLSDLDFYDTTDDADIQHTASSTGGELSVGPNQSLTIATGTTFSTGASTTIDGNYTNNGTIDGLPTITLASSSATYGGTGTSTLGNLIITGNYTAANQNATTSNLTIQAGASFTAPSGVLTLDGVFTQIGSFTENGGTLNLVGADKYTVSTGRFVDSLDVSGQEFGPQSIIFNDDGTKLYVVGFGDDAVDEWDLSTPYDVSTGVYNDTLDVSVEEAFPNAIIFNDDGTKLYVAGDSDEAVDEWDLSTPYDVSTGVYNDTLDVSAQESVPTGLAFNADGTKLYVVGYFDDAVDEWDLSTPYDVSTGVYNDTLDVSEYSGGPGDIAFSADGRKLYVVAFDAVLEFLLSAPYDVSTGVLNDQLNTFTQETSADGLAFNGDGSKLYVTGNDGDAVTEWDLTATHQGSFTGSHALGDVTIGGVQQTLASAASITDLTVETGTTFVAPTSTLDITGNYTNNGVFAANGGEVQLSGNSSQSMAGIMTGTSSLGRLTLTNTSGSGSSTQSVTFAASVTTTGTFTMAASTSARFAAGETYTFENIDWPGTSDSPIYLRSSSGGTQWQLDVPGTQENVFHVDVEDSDASLTTGGITVYDGTDSGNNTNWTFDTTVSVTVSGTLTDTTGTPISGETIAVAAGTPNTQVTTDTTDGSGAYSVTASGLILGSPILAYVDGTASVRGSAHTKVASTTADITNLDLTQNTLTLFQQGATSTTLSDLDFYDTTDDADIQHTVDTTGLPELTVGPTQSLLIATGTTFSTNASTTIDGSYTNNGTIDGLPTVTLSSSSATYGGTGTSTLGNLIITGTYTAADTNATTSDLTIAPGGSFTAPSDTLTIDGVFTQNGSFTENGGTLRLVGASRYDISAGVYSNVLDTSGEESSPSDIIFNADGTKVYVVGTHFSNGEAVDEWDLSTPYDVSTGSYVDTLDVSSESQQPEDIAFNSDGTKLYVLSSTFSSNHAVDEWDLSIPYDVSTGVYNDTLNISAEETSPTGLAFNGDGSKLYVIGRSEDAVDEWDLSTPYDVSTGVYNDTLDVSAQETDPYGLAFNADGTKLFVLGNNSKTVTQWALSNPYDVSTGVYVVTLRVSSQESSPTGLTFGADGQKLYIIGFSQGITEWDLTATHQGGFTGSHALGDVSVGGIQQEFASSASTTDLTIQSGTTFVAPTSLGINGDLSNNGSFAAGAGTVLFTGTSQQSVGGTFTGTSAFRDLTITNQSGDGTATQAVTFSAAASTTGTFTMAASTSARFAAGETYTFENIDWPGTSDSPIYLRSSSGGTQWQLDVPGTQENVFHVDVEDSDASLTTGGITVYDGTDSGNNTNWTFDTTVSVTVSGTLTDTTGTPISGETIAVAAGTPNTQVTTDTTDGSGAYSVTASGLILGSPILAYVDGTASVRGSAHTKVASTTADITNLDLTQNTLTLFQQGATSTTLSDLDFYDTTDDADIQHTVDTTGLPELTVGPTQSLLIATGTTFSTNASTTIDGSYTNNGTIDGLPTVTLSSSSATYGGTGTSTLGNLIITGTYTAADTNATTSDLTIAPGGSFTAPSDTLTIDGVFTQNGSFTENGGTLRLVGADRYGVSSGRFVDSFVVSDQQSIPYDLSFNDDGTKLYVIGRSGPDVDEWDLSTPYDVSTASHVDRLNVSAQQSFPRGMAFNNNGTKLYIVGSGGRVLDEWDLTVPYDVSTGSYVDTTDVSVRGGTPEDIAFNADGTKLYVVMAGVVDEWDLSTPYDVSTGVYNDTLDVSAQGSSPTGLTFNNDGTTLYVVSPSADAVDEWDLSTPYDVSTGVYKDTLDVSAEASGPWGLTFNNDGTTLYVVGNSDDAVDVWSLDAIYQGAFTGSNALGNVVVDGNGQRFVDAASTTNLTITNGSTLIAPTGTLSIARNATNSGAFRHNDGTVVFDGTTAQTVTGDWQSMNEFSSITISNTSQNGTTTRSVSFLDPIDADGVVIITSSSSVAMAAGVTSTFNTLILDGQSTTTGPVWLHSTQPGAQANLSSPNNISASAVYVQDINACDTRDGFVFDANGVDRGNATCWQAGAISGQIDVSGTVYSDQGSTPVGSGTTVTLATGLESIQTYSTTTEADGTFQLSDVLVEKRFESERYTLTLYVNGSSTLQATNVIAATSTTQNIANVALLADTVSIRSEIPEAVQLTDLANYTAADDTDIELTVATTTNELTTSDGSGLLIATGTTFSTNASTTIDGNYTNDGTIDGIPSVTLTGSSATYGGSGTRTLGNLSIIGSYTASTPNATTSNLTITPGGSFAAPTGALTVDGVFTQNGSYTENGNTLRFVGSDYYNVSSGEYVDMLDISNQETDPEGLTFNADGTKLYVVGNDSNNERVTEWDLGTPYDISTGVYNDALNISAQESTPTGLTFNADGTKLYVVGASDDAVDEWDLSTPYDISTGSYNDTLDISGQESFPTGLTFNADGTKLYVVGASDDAVDEWDLSTPYDISTGSYNDTLDISGQESSPQGIAFDVNGTRLYVAGDEFSNEKISKWTLSAPYDLSTASYDNALSVSAQEEDVTDLAFAGDGGTFYIIGDSFSDEKITEWFMPAEHVGGFVGSSALGSVVLSGTEQRFVNVASTSNVTVDGGTRFRAPAVFDVAGNFVNFGTYFASGTLAVAGDVDNQGEYIQVPGQSEVQLTGSGTVSGISATQKTDQITVSGTYSAATDIATKNLRITNTGEFTAPAGTLTIEGDLQQNGTFHANFGTVVVAARTYDVNDPILASEDIVPSRFDTSQESVRPSGIRFNADGTKMYTADDTNTFGAIDDIDEWSLSSPFDVTTASYVASLDVSSQDDGISALAFNDDGTKLYVSGIQRDRINEYALSTAYDVTSASYTDNLSVGSQSRYPLGFTFSKDGNKLFVVGTDDRGTFPNGEQISAWSLGTPFDVSTASFEQAMDLSTFASYPTDVALSEDGRQLLVLFSDRISYTQTSSGFSNGLSAGSVVTWTLPSPYDLSASTQSSTLDLGDRLSVPEGMTFTPDGSALYLIDKTTGVVSAWQLDSPVGIDGNFVGSNAFHNLRQEGNQPITFSGAASTTGTFTIASTSASGATTTVFNAGSTYTFQNIDWQGSDASTTINLRSSASGTPWQLDVPGSQLNLQYVDVQDSDATRTSGGVLALDSTDSGNNTNWTFGTPLSLSSAADQIFANSSPDSPISPITITDALPASITATNDIRITIATTSVDMRFDTSDTDATITGSASASVSSIVSYEDGGATLVLDVTSDFADSESVTVSDLSYTDFGTTNNATSALQLFVDGDGGTTPDATDDKTITIEKAAPVWNETDWTEYDTITIDAANIDEDLTDFPVYVDLADLSQEFLDTVASDGGDIRVTTNDASPVELPREVVSVTPSFETGSITREYWTGIGGTAISSLTSDPDYPDNPTGSDTLPEFEATYWADDSQSSDYANSYGQRVQGYLIAPETGDYTFWIASDDLSELYLNASGTATSGKQLIANVSSFTSYRQWTKLPSQESATISLTAGEAYYIEALHKEGGGGDSLSVGWRKPSDGAGSTPAEIVPGSALAPFTTTPGSGGGELHFKADSISSSTDTSFRIYYNGTTTGDYAVDATYGAENVWTNDYLAVYHFAEPANTDASGYADATANDHDGTGVLVTETGSSTKITGRALRLSGSERVELNDGISLSGLDAVTMSAWVNYDGSGTDEHTILSNWGGAGQQLITRVEPADDSVEIFVDTNGQTNVNLTDVPLTPNQWSYVTARLDAAGDGLDGHVDGVESANDTSAGTLSSATADQFWVGATPHNSGDNFVGLIDELRIAVTNRSNAWVAAEYVNQSTTTDFYYLGPALNATTTLGEHPEGQIDNAFSFMNKSDEPLFAFQLVAEGAAVTISELIFEHPQIEGATDSNVLDLRLHIDENSDGLLDVGDTAVATGTLMIADGIGSTTFSNEIILPAGSTNAFLLTADLDDIDRGDVFRINLDRVNISLDSEIVGAVSGVTHLRSVGGGGGGGSRLSTEGAPGAAIRGGGTAGGAGEELGGLPNFEVPSITGTPFDEWADGVNVIASDGTYATEPTAGERLSLSDFGYLIPDTNEITGIEVKLEASTDVGTGTIDVALSWDGGSSVTAVKTTDEIDGTDTIYTLGGNGDLWGRSWSLAEFNDANFRARLVGQPSGVGGNSVRVDAISVRVYHQIGGGNTGGGSGEI